MPNEILRLPGGFLWITVRVNERLNPSLRSSGGCRAGRDVSMNVCGDWMQMRKGVLRRALAVKMHCDRIGGKAQAVYTAYRGEPYTKGLTKKQ